jgi:glycosyltransferase involved in cell wall biosynthesis
MILFVGPLPPPVHGFSTINAAMLAALRGRDAVLAFDRAPGPGGLLRRLGREGIGLLRFGWAQLRHRPRSLYLGLSGGLGQALDALYLALGRRCPHRVVHHHSYAYLTRPSRLTRLCLGCAGGALHVALCPDMAARLTVTYGIPAERILVLSNVVFMEADAPASEPGSSGLRLGFLSAVTEAKGIFVFLEVLRQLQAQGLPAEGRIAGPLEPDLRARFERELAATPGAAYLGPLYGAAKQTFLQGLDALVFPTRYRNEAEPVVVLEALRAGVPVLATRRGCMAAQLEGQPVPALPEAGFAAAAAAWVQRGHGHPELRAEAHRQARAGFQVLQDRHRATLELLLARFQPPGDQVPP